MVRRWVLTAIVAAVLVAIAVVVAHGIRDDEPEADRTEPGATTSSAPRTTQPSTTTSAPATTAAPTTAAPTSTTGPPGPCGTVTGPIRAAIDAGVAGAAANADLTSCRLAASDPTWAAAELTPKPGMPFDARTVILHGPAGSWAIVAAGGANAGCGQAPQQVIVDLGQFCVGTGGSAQ
jgi:hypothetical protein